MNDKNKDRVYAEYRPGKCRSSKHRQGKLIPGYSLVGYLVGRDISCGQLVKLSGLLARTRVALVLAVMWLGFNTSVHAELAIEITEGVDNPARIAVVPMNPGGAMLSEDISAIVAADLDRSGLFQAMSRVNMLSFPKTIGEVYYRDWSVPGMEYLVVGDVQREPTGGYKVVFSLLQVHGERKLFTEQVRGSENELRDIAHYISDKVYKTITGVRGAFSTRIAYVTATPRGRDIMFRLMVSDADGARERLMLESKEPIMSPSWAPNASELVYVSFETGRPAIYRQRLSDAQREQVTNFRGLNGAPAWSPDGKKLALVLSKDGNPEIYLFSFATRAFTRVTKHFAIDTEPTWTPDGRALLFTSDRGGSPQIYKLTLDSGAVERITFEGSYNARPRLAPDGRTLVLVHRQNGRYHIASKDLVSNDFRILSETHLDESPTVSPNGAMVIYAAKQGNKGVLAAVSIDAGVRFLLPSNRGDVREPAWAPFSN